MNKNIRIKYLLLFFQLLLGTHFAWAQSTSDGKLLYSTDFTEWNDIDRKTTINKTVTQWTDYSNETLTFTLNGVGVDPKSTKFAKYTGYMITAKYTGEYSKSEPSVITSKLNSITRIVLTQAATGGTRGIKVSVKGDGDKDWVALHNITISKKDGEELTLDVNRTNCQIKFENFTLKENAYIVDLKIYGKTTGSSGIKMLKFKSNKDIIGKYPTKIKCDKDGRAVMPSGYTFSLPGFTFESWTDGTNDYTPGKTYTFTDDVTSIEPKMRKNSYQLYDTNKEATVVWNFDHTEAPALNIYSEHQQKDLSYTQPVNIYIDEKTTATQDVALDIHVKSGKIENTDERMNALNGEGALVKNGTQFTLPAIYGMKVTVKASSKVDPENGGLNTIFGTADKQVQIKLKDTANKDSLTLDNAEKSTDGKTVTFTYMGDEPTITLTPYVNQGSKIDNWFFESITATYPLVPNVVFVNSISNADSKTFPNEKPENAGKATITLKTPISSHGNIGNRYKVGDVVTVAGATPEYGYDFEKFQTGEATSTTSLDYTVKKGINNIEVIYERQKLYQVVVKPSDPSLGTVSLSPKYDNFYNEKYNDKGEVTQIECWYTEGTQVTATGEAITDYMIDYWKEENGTQHEGISYGITVGTSNQTLTAHFAQGHLGSVNFVIPEGTLVNGEGQKKDFKNAISVTPNSLNNVRSFTIPTNYTLFKSIDKDGKASEKEYTLKYWVKKDDDTNKHYELGNTYSFSTEGETITLVPVFEENSSTQDNRVNDPLIRYDFARKVKEYEDPSTESSTDPSTKEARKVCAQTVNIGKNKQMFWTSKVWVKVRENSVDTEHWRDAALWCDTGKKGYIRNEQFDNWCAFGPGTTFWFPAGTGTRISLMSYSKITTTTIDDSVPTLDRERTNIERKKVGLPSLEEEEKGAKSYMYVYTHTTQSPNLRAAIKIGDDYSYYQWLEIKMLAANWVTLHAATNDDLRGIIKDIQLVDKNHEIGNLEDGGLAFHKGERIRITLNRKKGYELDKILDLNTLDENGEPLVLLEMNDDGTTKYSIFDLTKTENYQTGKDHYLTSDSIRTKYVLEGNITNHRNLQVCFKEMKNTYYITYNAGNQAEGTSPEATWVEAGDRFVVPKNQTLYYEGNTLHHWVDGAGYKYEIGKDYEAPEKFIRMFPVFEPNAFNILNLTKEATATWHFAKNDGAPTINYEGTKGILVTQLVADGKSIDLKITLDGSKGKFNNVSNTKNPERIQINQGSVVEFPSTPGCMAKWTATEDGKKLTIAGTSVTTKKNQEVSAPCTGENAIQKVVFIDGAYSKSFSVTYKPQTATKATIESLTCNGKKLTSLDIEDMMTKDNVITFTVSPWDENGNETTLPEVTGIATNGTVTATKATVLSPECEATVKTQSGIVVETYPIKFIFEKPTVAPKLVKLTVNGTEYSDNKISKAPKSGVIKLNFNRTMEATSFTYGARTTLSSTDKKGKEQIIKYWDLPVGETVLTIRNPQDIYGSAYGQNITITLQVEDEAASYQQQPFDFIVGKDGDINEAVKAANGEAEGKKYNNTKADGQRYYIFVPDGEYELTGNTTISFTEEPVDSTGKKRPDMNGQNNHMTKINKSNISLIGQSKEGVKIWNKPIVEGISYTATLHLDKKATDFYAQDLTLENRFNYWGVLGGSSGAGRAVAFCDQGNRSVLKNVALMSWQDTYYSCNSSADYRGYFENCDLAGVVDWICGNGDIWFEKCNIIVRDRTGNNIAAPGTEVGQAWGYVFNNCTIRPETDKPTQLKGNDWTLARPWDHSPACTFLNTKMYTQPRTYGWNRMNAGKVVRFHEYNSVDDSDTQIPLETRSLAACSPAPGSDDCILTAAEATGYNIRNVMGGNDAFEPQELCKQIDAKSGLPSKKDEELEDREKVDTENHIIWDDNLVLDDDKLQWNDQKEALCYFLFKLDENGKWKYLTNVTDNFVNLTQYGTGDYCVRAANQRGGLGLATQAIHYTIADAIELEIKKVEGYKEDGVDYGWSTICLPFNARIPEGIKVYAATADETQDSTVIIKNFTMTLTEVDVIKVINANKGYVVYGPVGTYAFHSTSRKSDVPTILKGNPTSEYISSDNNNGYVLSYKSTWGLGFYKFTGSQLSPYRAWLPQNMVSKSNSENLALGKQAIHLVFAKGTSGILPPTIQGDQEEEKLFNLSGQPVEKATKGLVISRKKGKFIKR